MSSCIDNNIVDFREVAQGCPFHLFVKADEPIAPPSHVFATNNGTKTEIDAAVTITYATYDDDLTQTFCDDAPYHYTEQQQYAVIELATTNAQAGDHITVEFANWESYADVLVTAANTCGPAYVPVFSCTYTNEDCPGGVQTDDSESDGGGCSTSGAPGVGALIAIASLLMRRRRI